jgi:hypothetical protein
VGDYWQCDRCDASRIPKYIDPIKQLKADLSDWDDIPTKPGPPPSRPSTPRTYGGILGGLARPLPLPPPPDPDITDAEIDALFDDMDLDDSA